MAFGLEPDCRFDRLPFDPEDLDLLRGEILRVAGGRAEKVVTLRIRSQRTGSPVILRVSRVEAASPLALVISTELVWPEGVRADGAGRLRPDRRRSRDRARHRAGPAR